MLRGEYVNEHYELTDDGLPENYHYRDEGCAIAPSCLNCPLPVCIYDIPRGKQKHLKEIRDCEIRRLFLEEGKDAEQIAQLFGVSKRTVQRALRQQQSEVTQISILSCTRCGKYLQKASEEPRTQGDSK